MPLKGYATLFGVFNLGLLAMLASCRKSTRSMRLGDYLLLGITTYKVAHILSNDRATSFIRAPFTEYQGSGEGSQVKEIVRGRGLQRAVGDLLTCPYCLSPWVACALVWGFHFQPAATRSLASVMALASLSDCLNQG